VLSSIRKLPERRAHAAGSGENARASSEPPSCKGGDDVIVRAPSEVSTPQAIASAPKPARPDAAGGSAVGTSNLPSTVPGATNASTRRVETDPREPRGAHTPDAGHTTPVPRATAPARASRAPVAVEPLSPGRYKVVFMADADLKQKLDLARDLLRHAVPDGELPAIIGRALDLLLEKTLHRRFAMTTRRKPQSPAAKADATSGVSTTLAEHAASKDAVRSTPSAARAANVPAPSGATAGAQSHGEPSTTTASDRASVTSPRPTGAHDIASAPPPPSTAPQPVPSSPPHSRHLSNPTRRAVLERDGLRCAWIGPDGTRCESRAWLEHDHIVPRGLGGDDEPSNVRICCRAHNRLAAEQAYGEPAIARIIARRRARRDPGESGDVNRGERRA